MQAEGSLPKLPSLHPPACLYVWPVLVMRELSLPYWSLCPSSHLLSPTQSLCSSTCRLFPPSSGFPSQVENLFFFNSRYTCCSFSHRGNKWKETLLISFFPASFHPNLCTSSQQTFWNELPALSPPPALAPSAESAPVRWRRLCSVLSHCLTWPVSFICCGFHPLLLKTLSSLAFQNTLSWFSSSLYLFLLSSLYGSFSFPWLLNVRVPGLNIWTLILPI